MKSSNRRSNAVVVVALIICAGIAFAAPQVRVKRNEGVAIITDAEYAVNPTISQIAESIGEDLDRDKRKIPDPKYETKNAILGFVFGVQQPLRGLGLLKQEPQPLTVLRRRPPIRNRNGTNKKINSFIDAKTRFIDKLDHANIEKNKQHHIEPPKPVPDFQSLISSVITPKVQFITSKIGSLSGSFLGSSSSNHGGDDEHHGNGGSGSAPQLGNIVSSLLKLSGPILSGSSGSQHGSTNTVSLGDHDDEE